MNLRSLGRRTDLIFSRFSGTVEDKGHFIVIKTPTNPGFHWGNYIIFDRAPKAGDLVEWKTLFDKEFPYYEEPHHYTFTWDCEDTSKSDHKEFLDAGFDYDSGVVLTCSKLNQPPFPNSDIQIKKIQTDEEWEAATELQVLCADKKYLNDYYIDFKRAQMDQYRKMSEKGLGHWFGSFLGEKLVGDLGVFFEGKVGRYQSVGTHPDYRRQGICGTLVHEAGQLALREFGVEFLVMEADPDYHAARVYESVGFQRGETNYSLSWWKGKNG